MQRPGQPGPGQYQSQMPPQQQYGSQMPPQQQQQYGSQIPPQQQQYGSQMPAQQQYGSQMPPPGVNPQEYAQISQWFQAVDTDKSGQISLQELHKCLSMGGNNFSLEVVQRLILTFDQDRSGQIGIFLSSFNSSLF